jgi:DNA-binding response OmpR family regulator
MRMGKEAALSMSGRVRLLVADDNNDAADTLAMILGMMGYAVRVAYGGLEAIAVAQEFRPQAAILDVGMPELDGYQVAQELRRQSAGCGLVLIALTGWGDQDDRQCALLAGFDHHFTKPVDCDALVSVLPREAAEAS